MNGFSVGDERGLGAHQQHDVRGPAEHRYDSAGKGGNLVQRGQISRQKVSDEIHSSE